MGTGSECIPGIKTIVDPLYEPARFVKYPWCEHLENLLTKCHLPYFFSPYLLLDVAKASNILSSFLDEGQREQLDERHRSFREKCKTHLSLMPGASDDALRDPCASILSSYEEIMACYNRHLRKHIYSQNDQKEYDKYLVWENYHKLSSYFQLDHVVEVECPVCEKSAFMSEGTRIYDNLQALRKTFELRRSRWLYQSGSLHMFYGAATHTRLAHIVGCLIAAIDALQCINVYPSDERSIPLGPYLMLRGKLHEFLAAVLLHDLGHPPLSHILEINPFIELNHEQITQNLIAGRLPDDLENNWYNRTLYFLKLQAVLDYVKAREQEGKLEQFRENFTGMMTFLDPLEFSPKIVTVNGVLVNLGIDPQLTALLLTEEKKRSSFDIWDQYSNTDRSDVAFVHALLDSKIDIDRIDHVRRDSAACGLSLVSFRVKELLQALSVILPGSKFFRKKTNAENEESASFYMCVSPDGLMYVMDLLHARRLIFKSVLFSDANNFINGVINQTTTYAVRLLPHLSNVLPFITDQILAYFYAHRRFIDTPVERLLKLFQGKADYSSYWEPQRWQLKSDYGKVPWVTLQHIYDAVIEISEKQEERRKLALPAIVFYTNFEIERDRQELNSGSGVYEGDPLIDLDQVLTTPANENRFDNMARSKQWESWLVFQKRYSDGETHSFSALAMTYHEKSTREFFPALPNEGETKNLFYVWVNRQFNADQRTEIINSVRQAILENLIGDARDGGASSGK